MRRPALEPNPLRGFSALADWRIEYNTYRSHSALGMLAPVEFADQWRRTSPPQLS
jgi:transposase InsO family protein